MKDERNESDLQSKDDPFREVLLPVIVRSAIARLNPVQRKLIGAVFYRGRSLRQAAEECGLAYATAWDRLDKAFESLRSALGSVWVVQAWREEHDCEDND